MAAPGQVPHPQLARALVRRSACRLPATPPPTPACPCSRAAGGLQTPADAALLAKRGVTTVFCLQEDSDLAYFSIDIAGIQAACE